MKGPIKFRNPRKYKNFFFLAKLGLMPILAIWSSEEDTKGLKKKHSGSSSSIEKFGDSNSTWSLKCWNLWVIVTQWTLRWLRSFWKLGRSSHWLSKEARYYECLKENFQKVATNCKRRMLRITKNEC